MTTSTDWIDVNSGTVYSQDRPYGPLTAIRTGDNSAPPSQIARSFEYLTASGRDLRPAATTS